MTSMDTQTVGTTQTDGSLGTSPDAFLQLCEANWPAGQPRARVITRCPGRLDCMGGMGDYSGGLALQMPIDRLTSAAAGPRSDQKIRVQSLNLENGEPAVFEWPLALFYQSDGQFTTAAELASHLEACPWARHVAAVCLALLDSGDLPHFAGGFNLLIHSDIPSGAGLASSAALQIASATALAGLFDAKLDALQIARACRTADAEILGAQRGLIDHLPCLVGEKDALLQIRSQPAEILGPVALPAGVMFAAVNSGIRLPICRDRYADNRVSALIGHYLIERMLSGVSGDPNSGYLANVSPGEYVERFRNELPVKVRGKEFLQRYGQPEQLDAQIDPDQIYKVRSRTEHHIYENERAHRYIERLVRARRSGERDALVEAGELMYASHWSYSQRCGMGSIETDVLVTAIRESGPARGLYGARVTDMGCGGTVAVLMASAPGARAALEDACKAYTAKSGHAATVIYGSSAGAVALGCRRLD
jgi:galactokinase